MNVSMNPRSLNLIHEIILEKKDWPLLKTITSVTIDASAWIFTVKNLRTVIRNFNPKTPGYDLITNQILQKMPETEIKLFTQLHNAVLR